LPRVAKLENDRRDGDTYEVVYRNETGAQRQKTLKARTVQRALVEAEEYRTQIRRGEIVFSSRLTFSDVAQEYFTLMESLVATGERHDQEAQDQGRHPHRPAAADRREDHTRAP
jgi:hypothetical protein